ncbi:MAG: thiamine-phosphate kinase [Ignavibacteriaceae bacterium]|nr:thiamine-phosphate kinase [Ignavibacteriaceae bacterium]
MQVNTRVSENLFIENLVKNFTRSPFQVNGLQESDAELIRLDNTNSILAITTDSISEEISSGLYDDFRQAGWMAVMINLSDLAAVGALPLGLVMQETLPVEIKEQDIMNIQMGIHNAVQACGTYILGGDTNRGRSIMLGGTALGIISDGKPMTRKGCTPGDILCTTGKPGLGNAYAFEKLFIPAEKRTITYLPKAKLQEGYLIKQFASACIDSSDGFIAALDQLMQVNGCGFRLFQDTEVFTAQEALPLVSATGTGAEIFLSAIHGDFELVFTVPPGRAEELTQYEKAGGFSIIKIGEVIEEPAIEFLIKGKKRKPDTGYIRNLYERYAENPGGYLNELTAVWNNS